ncbi:hypothetical protein CSC27_0002 [Pseudomonas aeruginosa]|nr:hypothetical protein CSC27_0002 [Pseudomonas aeruginosa]
MTLLAQPADAARQRARPGPSGQLVQYKQQIARANLAEEQLLQVQQQLTDTRHQLQERIAHVSTAYRAAPGAAPTAIPRCVFTRGWVRDFNTALGASLSATGARTASAGTQAATWPAAGSDAELLESGVTPADILALPRTTGPGLFASRSAQRTTGTRGIGNEGRAGTVAVDHSAADFLGPVRAAASCCSTRSRRAWMRGSQAKTRHAWRTMNNSPTGWTPSSRPRGKKPTSGSALSES